VVRDIREFHEQLRNIARVGKLKRKAEKQFKPPAGAAKMAKLEIEADREEVDEQAATSRERPLISVQPESTSASPLAQPSKVIHNTQSHMATSHHQASAVVSSSSIPSTSSRTTVTSIDVKTPDGLPRFAVDLSAHERYSVIIATIEYKKWMWDAHLHGCPAPHTSSAPAGASGVANTYVFNNYAGQSTTMNKNETYVECFCQGALYLLQAHEISGTTHGLVALGPEFQRLKLIAKGVLAVEIVDADSVGVTTVEIDQLDKTRRTQATSSPFPSIPAAPATVPSFVQAAVPVRDFIARYPPMANIGASLPFSLVRPVSRSSGFELCPESLQKVMQFAVDAVRPVLGATIGEAIRGVPGPDPQSHFDHHSPPNPISSFESSTKLAQGLNLEGQTFDLYRGARQRRSSKTAEDWAQLSAMYVAPLPQASNQRGPPPDEEDDAEGGPYGGSSGSGRGGRRDGCGGSPRGRGEGDPNCGRAAVEEAEGGKVHRRVSMPVVGSAVPLVHLPRVTTQSRSSQVCPPADIVSRLWQVSKGVILTRL
jgi:hypothetical protein